MSEPLSAGPAVPLRTSVACGLLVAFLAPPLQAQQIPTGYQEYFIVGHEQHVWSMMNRVRLGEGGGAFASGTNSVVSAVASADNQVIFYDQWEDGFEGDILSPAQASTVVLGDNNAANGRACDWTTDPRVACGGPDEDHLFRGSFIVLNSDQGPFGACAAPDVRRCYVPVNFGGFGRNAADVRFDGGDRLVTSGGPLAVIHSQDPLNQFIGGATEMISREAVAGATSYYVPIGEDLFTGDNQPFEPFQYVDVEIVSFDDGTGVFIDSPGPGGGTVSFTLNRGQHYSSRGHVDNTQNAALALTITAGTKISTTKPVNGMIFTGGVGTYSTDFFALLPDLMHGTDYILPTHGDNTGVGNPANRPLNIFTFNPNPISPITVSMTDNPGPGFAPITANVTVPANSQVDYSAARGRFVPYVAGVAGTNGNYSTVRLTSDRPFWGVSTLDHQTVISDWGYSWLATRFATRTYTVSYAPGVTNPALLSQPAQRIANDTDCTIPPTGVGTCNSENRSPVWIAATQDNTRVRVDFDNDGFTDFVDLNGDDCPDNGQINDVSCGPAPPACPGSPALTNCVYVVNALQSLRVFDSSDYDNTGTSVVANKPVLMAAGQDPDRGVTNDNSVDTGYVVFPINREFLDPVLVLDKTTSVNAIPTSGGAVTYTLAVSSFDHGPISSLQVYDLLPPGIPGSAYVAGSTLVTYPDLTQSTADPAITTPGGRTRLTWTLSPDQLDPNRVLTIRYTINLPAGPIALLTNEAHADGIERGNTFSTLDTADVVRTDVVIAKSAAPQDLTPEPGELITYTLQVSNTGATNETSAVIIDPIPANTRYVAGSVTASGPFTGVFSSAQNAVVWTAATFSAATGPFTLTFQVRINPGVPVDTVITNAAGYQSTQTPYFLSNPVETVVVGPTLEISKAGPAIAHPGERVMFEIHVKNAGTSTATNVFILDPAPSNATYTAGTMEFSLNAGPYTSLTDGADADAGTAFVDRLEFLLATLGPGQDVVFRFEADVTGASGQFVNNQATVSADQVNADDTNLVQTLIVGNAVVTGHVFLDLDGDGTLDPGEPGINDVHVLVTDSTGLTQIAHTDANGDYTVTVPAGSTTLNVDENDPDIPAGSTLTTANDTQTPTAVSGSSVATTPVGYDPPPLSVLKTSNAPNGELVPGQTVTYTITVTNYTGTSQTGIQVADALPNGTSYVVGSTLVTAPGTSNTFRVTEYPIGTSSGSLATFPGTTLNLTLNQNLVSDYFVIVQGSDGNGTANGTRTPDQNYVALTGAPAGTPGVPAQLTASGAANRLVFTRNANNNAWVGVITVAECLGDCTTSGFRLLDVQRVAHTGTSTAGTDTSTVAWSDVNKVLLMGGFNGAGCNTADNDAGDHDSCHARIFPSGANTINWTRDNTTGGMETATSTVMVVEWGSEWKVQRRRVRGNNGGDGANATNEYNIAAINPVFRDRTWVWGTGHTNDDGIGDAAEGVLLTLGDGVNQSAIESQLAAGIEVNNNAVDFEVYSLSHPFLAVDYRFKADADSANLTVNVPVDAAPTANARMALSYNGGDLTDTTYPRPMLSARYTSDTNVQLERRRTGANFPAWVQGIGFSAIKRLETTVPASGGAPPTLVAPSDGYSLPAGRTMVITYQATVAFPLDPAITQIQNTATMTTDQPGVSGTGSVTDQVVRPGVTVEYNNAGFAFAGESLVYFHDVINTGMRPDSFDIRLEGELGWVVELLDPDTGALLARDSDGDGTWDGGITINTGTLAVGASRSYHVRVNTSGAASPGTTQSTRLFAISTRSPLVSEYGTDETTILGPADFGPVVLLPDNSGVVTAGGYVAYTHRVINRTGAADTFDLQVITSNGWTARFFYDSNGDGEYTPGVGGDIQISNTLQLADNASQLVFMVVDCPLGTAANTTDVAALQAFSRNDPLVWDAATDTTTVVAARSHDLSGGGSRLVQPGITAVFPGTLYVLAKAIDTFNFRLTPSSLFGADAALYGTQLWVDTDGDGAADTMIGDDTDGDGTWDTVLPGYDTDGDNRPDVTLTDGAILAYELRRPIDPAMRIPQEFVTFTAASTATGDNDSVTATVLLAAVTRAGVRGLRVDTAGVVEFATSTQRGTLGFRLYESDDPSGRGELLALADEMVRAPVPDSVLPILYRARTRPLAKPFLFIEELETGGGHRRIGPFALKDARLSRTFARIETRFDQAGVARGDVRLARGADLRRLAAADARRSATPAKALPPSRPSAPAGVKIIVGQTGTATVPLADIEAMGLSADARLRLSNQGREVEVARAAGPGGEPVLVFSAEELTTDYTGRNVYVLTAGQAALTRTVPLTRSGDPRAPGAVRIEKTFLYLATAPLGTDPWLWDLLVPDSGPWPYPWWDPEVGRFDLPGLVPGATGSVPVRLRLLGYTNHRHTVEAWINGVPAGSATFDGVAPGLLTGAVPAESLRPTGNELTLLYSAASLDPDIPDADGLAYLDHLELEAPVTPSASPVPIEALEPYRPQLPDLSGVRYLIVTHPLFREQANRIAALKQAEGLATAVVETTTAYDRFSAGIPEANAIRALIRHARSRSEGLHYVLLVGDDTVDPRDILGTGSVSYVPSLLAWDGVFGRIPSENLYADVDDDGRPDLAIGRLPVQTLEQAVVAADKVAGQAQALGQVAGRHLFAVDNSPADEDAPFRSEAEEMSAKLPPDSQIAWSDVADGVGPARTALRAAWEVGALATHYFGHGGPEVWADESLLTVDDVPGLEGVARPTLLFTWACESQWYLNFWGPTVNEALFLLPGGGAYASFGPSGISSPAAQRALYESLYADALSRAPTLGEAIRQAKARALEREPASRTAVEGFNLFGDPALRLPR